MGDSAQEVWVRIDGERLLVQVEDLHQRPVVAIVDGRRFEIDIEEGEADPDAGDDQQIKTQRLHSIPAGTSCEVISPMPGDIMQIHVKPGQVVQAGDPLCILDAMKMKNTIHAPQDGAIAEVFVSEGQSVEYGVPLFRLG